VVPEGASAAFCSEYVFAFFFCPGSRLPLSCIDFVSLVTCQYCANIRKQTLHNCFVLFMLIGFALCNTEILQSSATRDPNCEHSSFSQC
jgi:hypothetical protein